MISPELLPRTIFVDFVPNDIRYYRHKAPGDIGWSWSETITTAFVTVEFGINLNFTNALLSAHIDPPI